MLVSPILFGIVMASIDVVILSMLKLKHMGKIKTQWVFVLAFLVYGMQALIFYKALDFAKLSNMNMLWDVTSDVFVTIVGIYLFKEAVSDCQKIGIVLGITALILLHK